MKRLCHRSAPGPGRERAAGRRGGLVFTLIQNYVTFARGCFLLQVNGTTGWSANVAGLPTALWTPPVQISDAGLGVRTGQFGFTINGAGGLTVVVEASTNLANPTWYPLATNTRTSGSASFSDPQWTNYPARFYRVAVP